MFHLWSKGLVEVGQGFSDLSRAFEVSAGQSQSRSVTPDPKQVRWLAARKAPPSGGLHHCLYKGGIIYGWTEPPAEKCEEPVSVWA